MEQLIGAIKERARKEHLRQVDLARILGVSQAMVSDVLSGKKPVTIGKFAQGLLRWDPELLSFFVSQGFAASNDDSTEETSDDN